MEKRNLLNHIFALVSSGLLAHLSFQLENPVLRYGAVGISLATFFAFWIEAHRVKESLPGGPQAKIWNRPRSSYLVTSPTKTPLSRVINDPEKRAFMTPEQFSEPLSTSLYESPSLDTDYGIILFRRTCQTEFLHLTKFFWHLSEEESDVQSSRKSSLKTALKAIKLTSEDVILHPTFTETVHFKTGPEKTKALTYFAAEVNPLAKVVVDHKWLTLEKTLEISAQNFDGLSNVLYNISKLQDDLSFQSVCLRKGPWFRLLKTFTSWGKIMKKYFGGRKQVEWEDEEEESFCPHFVAENSGRFFVITFVKILSLLFVSGLSLSYLIQSGSQKIWKKGNKFMNWTLVKVWRNLNHKVGIFFKLYLLKVIEGSWNLCMSSAYSSSGRFA